MATSHRLILIVDSLVFQLQDSNETFSGKDFNWDANKGFLKNIADKVYIAPKPEQIALVESYNKSVRETTLNKAEFLKTFDDTDPLKSYFTTLDGGIATQKGMTGALNRTTIASKATAAGMTLLNTAMNMGIMLAVSAAITGIVKGLDYLIVTLKEQKEIVEQASTEFKTLTSDIEALNKQLATSATRIDELNGKDTLSLIEQEELARLKETNTELATPIVSGALEAGQTYAIKYDGAKLVLLGFSQISAIAYDNNPDSPFYVGANKENVILQVFSDGEYAQIWTNDLAIPNAQEHVKHYVIMLVTPQMLQL